MTNILITGANGQLASEIKSLMNEFSSNLYFFCDKQTLDITEKVAIANFVVINNIDVIINCAAYTAVDLAEEEQKLANNINHLGIANLAEIAKNANLKLVHISTDYVFNGMSHIPYTTEDKTEPLGIYGKTKYNGELALKKINPANSIIIRTAWVYSSFCANFVKTMLRLGDQRESLGVIYDQIGSPTYAKDLARTILNIIPQINNSNVELFHYTNEGVCSWYDFAKAIFDIKKIDCKVNALPSSAYPTKVKRPNYSVLDKSKLKEAYNIEIPYWRDSLKSCLEIL